jgi:hypothetical protein
MTEAATPFVFPHTEPRHDGARTAQLWLGGAGTIG